MGAGAVSEDAVGAGTVGEDGVSVCAVGAGEMGVVAMGASALSADTVSAVWWVQCDGTVDAGTVGAASVLGPDTVRAV